MRVFVTGATGFIGSAIVKELMGAGHSVLGLVRSEANAQALAATGAAVLRGALADADTLARGVAESDGVIHTAYDHDFVNVSREAALAAELRTIATLGTALAGSKRPLVITSGLGRVTPGQSLTEEDVPPAVPPARVAAENAALAFAKEDVRAMVVRLPPSVHGDGDHGFVPELIAIARDKGVSAFVGDGSNRWPAVHRLDAALLFRLALEKGQAGARFHGVADAGIPTRDIAAAIGQRLNLPVVSKPPEEAPAHFGWLGHFFGWDVPASSAQTRERLGWQPRGPGLIADLEHGRYFA